MLVKDKSDLKLNLEDLPVSDFWTENDQKPLKMHRIHWYPAKFPPYLVSKAFDYARNKNIKISNVVDFFCGCGTTPLESIKQGYNFWGCDINPVATLIASVKSRKYNSSKLDNYYNLIIENFDNSKNNKTKINNERLQYWFPQKQLKELDALLSAIKKEVPKGVYRDFFLCAYSNILRGCSRWLTKSIKPQIDPNKNIKDVISSFNSQYKMMYKANLELIKILSNNGKIKILNKDYLNIDIKENIADIVITSPPYVTSYEYADLHQLSTLLLGFVKDYRELRKGTVGSLYNTSEYNFELENLNSTANEILQQIKENSPNKVKSIAKYFSDIYSTVDRTYYILKNNSLAFFVIGNTQYKGVHIDNAKYLLECMLNKGFADIEIYKREIGNKILTRYRDGKGKFTKDPFARKVYNIEFIIIARKK